MHAQVKFFNETLTNVFMKLVPNKLISDNDREPPWVTEQIKDLVKDKGKL